MTPSLSLCWKSNQDDPRTAASIADLALQCGTHSCGIIKAMPSLISRYPILSALAALAGLALATFLFFYFEPQRLFIEDRVNEDAPQPTLGPKILGKGNFRSLEHESSGQALIIELPDGSKTLRFEDLKTSNGPDLVVYLSPVPATAGWRAYGEGFVDLGQLKGNIGDQNYEIPTGIDTSRYKSAVVWCRRFSVGFAVAPLA